jgi:hypothetical protein
VRVRLRLGVAVAALAAAVPADAAYHYRGTISWSGRYVSEELDGGVVTERVTSIARWRVRDPNLVVTVQRGAIALFPSGYTRARLRISQSGFTLVCESVRQPFRDRVRHQPTLAWLSLGRSGNALGFGWSGEAVDRRTQTASQGDCTEAGMTEAGGGNGDVAATAGMAGRFGVRLKISRAALYGGHGIVRRIRVRKRAVDVLDGSGSRATLTGTFLLVLVRVR